MIKTAFISALFASILLLSCMNVQAQLIFKLEGTVTDTDTKEPLGNVKVKLVSDRKGVVDSTLTDSSGFYQFKKRNDGSRIILPKTSYTITVGAMNEPASNGFNYLEAKAQESTKGLKQSTAFVHDFALVCSNCGCDGLMPVVFMEECDTLSMEDSNWVMMDALYQIMIENPAILIGIEGFSLNQIDEEANIECSKQRAEFMKQYLVNRGIDERRIQTTGNGSANTGVILSELKQMGDGGQYALQMKWNKVSFQVLSWDFEAD